MNLLQFLGLTLYTMSLVKLITITHFGKRGELIILTFFLFSGIILCSANAGLNLKIAVSLIMFAASVIIAPFIQFKKKGER